MAKDLSSMLVCVCMQDECRLAVFVTGARGWTTDEEERLLEAVDLYSIGNWLDILLAVSPRVC